MGLRDLVGTHRSVRCETAARGAGPPAVAAVPPAQGREQLPAVGPRRLSKGPGIDELATVLVHPGDCWRTRPGEVHTVEALDPSEILEASTPQLDDVIRLMDDYGRASERSPEVAHPVPTPPARLLDRDLIAVRLGVRRDEVMARISDPTFPDPAGYSRGRMLWGAAAPWVNQPADAAATERRAG